MSDKRRKFTLGHDVQRHFGQLEDWFVCVSLVTRTCIVWPNAISRICKSIGRYFKRSVITLSDLLTISLSDHMKWRYVWQKAGIKLTLLYRTPFRPVRRLNFLSIAGYVHLRCLTVRRNALSRIFQSIGRHFKRSVDTLTVQMLNNMFKLSIYLLWP